MKNRDNYPVDWFDTIRPRILKRDNYRCRKCRIANRQLAIKENGIVQPLMDDFEIDWAKRNNKRIIKIYLVIAHLNHITSDNKDENLLTLCPTCHFANDLPMNLVKRLMKKK